MKFRVKQYSLYGQLGFIIQTKIPFLPFYKLFLYGINEGGGQYFIFEPTYEKAVLKFKSVIKPSNGYM